jgi:hypothetical protein
MKPQNPAEPPENFFPGVQAMHLLSQALSQQTRSTQKPEPHSEAALQAAPVERLVASGAADGDAEAAAGEPAGGLGPAAAGAPGCEPLPGELPGAADVGVPGAEIGVGGEGVLPALERESELPPAGAFQKKKAAAMPPTASAPTIPTASRGVLERRGGEDGPNAFAPGAAYVDWTAGPGAKVATFCSAPA